MPTAEQKAFLPACYTGLSFLREIRQSLRQRMHIFTNADAYDCVVMNISAFVKHDIVLSKCASPYPCHAPAQPLLAHTKAQE